MINSILMKPEDRQSRYAAFILLLLGISLIVFAIRSQGV